MSRNVEDELVGIAHDGDRAMVANDADAIGRYLEVRLDAPVAASPDGSKLKELGARRTGKWS